MKLTAHTEKWMARAADAEGVVFDFGGVISRSPLADWDLYPYCAARGITRAMLADAWRRYRHLWDGGDITFNEQYRRIFADAGLPPPDAATLADLWHVDAESWIRDLRADTLDLMRAVKASGRKIGILSNMAPDFHERLFVPRAAAYRALADVEVISGLVRLCKPARAIYDLAQARMGIPAGRLLFLDDFPSNVDAARAAGWQSELYDTEEDAA